MEWAVWVEWVEWECNPNTHKSQKIYKKASFKAGLFYLKSFKKLFVLNFLETNKQAELFKILPSFTILRLLAFKVDPVEVISVISSAEPVKG